MQSHLISRDNVLHCVTFTFLTIFNGMNMNFGNLGTIIVLNFTVCTKWLIQIIHQDNMEYVDTLFLIKIAAPHAVMRL
jgi:hypothetical protein